MSFDLSDYFDEEDVLTALEEVETNRFWRPTKDKTILRILPPIKKNGERLFYFTHKVHWINKVPYECLNQTLVDKDGKEHVAEPCPICNLAKQLYKAGDTDEEALKEARSISAKTKDVVRMIVRDDGDFKVHFYEIPFSVKRLLVTAISSGDFGSPVIHPTDGNDFALQRQGSGQLTKYDSSYILPKKAPIAGDKETIIKVLQEAEKANFNSVVSFQTPEFLKEVLRSYAGGSKEEREIPVVRRDVNEARAVEKEDVSKLDDLKASIENDSSQDDDLNKLLGELTGDLGF